MKKVLFYLALSLSLGACTGTASNQTSSSSQTSSQTSQVTQSVYASQSAYRPLLEDRYQAYGTAHPDFSPDQVVIDVNVGIDQPIPDPVPVLEGPMTPLTIISKRMALPADYLPSPLVPTPSACVIGVDYSCQSVDVQEILEPVAQAFAGLVEAAAQEGFSLKAIASYRSYSYQESLFQTAVANVGLDQAKLYYAQPGQSEHNTGYAMDWMIDDIPYNQIETSPYYPWLLEHAADYGFILRYLPDKLAYHEYAYESWHFRYVGVEAAKIIYQEGWTLEEYLAHQEEDPS